MNFSVFVVILKPETNMKLGNQIHRCKKDSWESFHGRQIVWNTEYFKNPNSQHLLSKMCNAPKFSNRTIVMSSWESEIHTSVYITYCIYIYISLQYYIWYIYINYIYITLHGLQDMFFRNLREKKQKSEAQKSTTQISQRHSIVPGSKRFSQPSHRQPPGSKKMEVVKVYARCI